MEILNQKCTALITEFVSGGDGTSCNFSNTCSLKLRLCQSLAKVMDYLPKSKAYLQALRFCEQSNHSIVEHSLQYGK